MEGLVSIITPTFNSEAFIIETIRSVQEQTYQNWELIIVDDASTDDTAKVVKVEAYKDIRIQFHELEINLGAGVARNFAIGKAKGKYIAFLDADDLWKFNKLEKQIYFLNEKQIPFTFSFYDCINEGGKLIGKSVEAPLKLTYRQLFFCNYVGNLTGIYDTEYFGKIEISSVRKRQDWTMWLTILKKIKVAYVVPESLAFYRVHQNSISASKLKLLKYNFNVYRKYHRLNLIHSLICMVGFLFTQLVLKPKFVRKEA
ncbi:glycosyltransferase family 2 protein [Flavobacterium tegetincola]|uniref:glycosyltransferase family 2 protein n=1 Tax=Flavobacterium tegetincola TaxID=150172 RepID=UPI0004225484|nr:glycosyltransferase family 2 protein [Flavobacterium tegetincola]